MWQDQKQAIKQFSDGTAHVRELLQWPRHSYVSDSRQQRFAREHYRMWTAGPEIEPLTFWLTHSHVLSVWREMESSWRWQNFSYLHVFHLKHRQQKVEHWRSTGRYFYSVCGCCVWKVTWNKKSSDFASFRVHTADLGLNINNEWKLLDWSQREYFNCTYLINQIYTMKKKTNLWY